MDHIQKSLQVLEKQLISTENLAELEPYILTKDEENRAISGAIKGEISHLRWKLRYNPEKEKIVENWASNEAAEALIDRDRVLKFANTIKLQDLWHKSQRQKEREEAKKKAELLAAEWDSMRMYKLMCENSRLLYAKKLVVNQYNSQLITALCYFLGVNPLFESPGKIIRDRTFSFNKGLLIRGTTGLGKTHLVRCLENNPRFPILSLSMLEITEEIMANGEFEFNLGDKRIIYLDDVGSEEPVVKYYGTVIMFFKKFIEMTYLKRTCYNHLIITTNLNFKQMEERYGFRVVSRMREMFNVIDVTGSDMRIVN